MGWVELGNHLEANAELERIEAVNRAHPDVLQVRWRVYALVGKWEACLDLAKAIARIAPERAFGWLHISHALRKLDRIQEALDNMVDALGRFPPNATMPFYAACYCAQLGKIAEARAWLEKAFANAESQEVRQKLKLRALDEPDLKPVWQGGAP